MTESRIEKTITWSGRPGQDLRSREATTETKIPMRLRLGVLALAGTSLLTPFLSACGGGEKENGVTVTTLIPTSTAAHETIEGGLPSAQTPIIETSTSSPSIEPTEPVPTETLLTPETHTVFDNLRTKITSLESTEQQELLIFINHFEQTESVLNKFKIAY